MLRTTIAVFAAGIGGADAITVLPFTAAHRPARPLRAPHRAQHPARAAGGIQHRQGRRPGRRLRRHRGSDGQALRAPPGRCSRRSRQAGGAPAALKRGLIQDKVAAVRAEREAAIAHRKDALTGTSDFPNLAEAPVAVLDVAPRADRRRPSQPSSIRALPPHPPRRAVRASARRLRPRCWPRPARGRKSSSPISAAVADFTRARDFRQEFLRGRRHRGGRQRRLQEPRRDDRGLQSLRREARLPVLVRRGLRTRGRRRRQGAGRGRRDAYLSGGPAGDAECAARPPASEPSSTPAATCWRRCKAAHDILAIRSSNERDEPHPGFRQGRFRGDAAAAASAARGRTLAHARRHPGEAGLRPGRPRGPRLPRHLSRHRALSARPLPDHVRHPAVDHPAICRLLHGRGFQRLLPAQSRRRAEGPLGRLRSRHPSRLRLRPSARRRRRRHGGRRDRFDLRHAHAVLRHPARPDDACR